MTKLLVWWQLRSVNPDDLDDGWLSWDHERERPFRFNTATEAFAALETFKRDRAGEDERNEEISVARNGKWFLAEGWSGRVIKVVQEQSYFDVEPVDYPDGHDTS